MGIPEHAPRDPDPKDVSWWEDWYNALGASEKLVRYGYLSAVEPKLTSSCNEWQDCEKSCATNVPPNCHWFVFDTVKKECSFDSKTIHRQANRRQIDSTILKMDKNDKMFNKF